MQVAKINTNSMNDPVFLNRHSDMGSISKTRLNSFESDIFIKNTPKNQIPFTGHVSFENFIIGFLKNKSYNTSIKGSKRPYLSICKNLQDIITPVDIKVSKTESIQAWDINPKNSKKYVIILHGFSQNITSNQPLYNVLKNTDFGILAIDYRGYGKNPVSKHITENDIVQDVNASVKYLNSKGINYIGLVGHSFGSYIAAKISNIRNFNFQILVSPMISLEFWLKNVLKHPNKYKNEIRMIKYIPNFKNQYSKIFNITKHLEHNSTPTHVVQAKKDTYIRTSKINSLVKLIPNLKTYTIIQDGGHRMDNNKINQISDILENL